MPDVTTTPLPVGIVSRLHSTDMARLMAAVTGPRLPMDWLTFSGPVLRDDIVYHNRSFFWLNFGDPITPNFIEKVSPTTSAPTSCNAGRPDYRQLQA